MNGQVRESAYAPILPRGVPQAREHELGGGGLRPNPLIWSWYRVAGRETTRPYQAKLWLLLGLLRGVPESSVIAVGSRGPETVREVVSAPGGLVGR